MNAVLEKKYSTLDHFIERVRAAAIGDNIVKMILYGSLPRGEATPESDIDLLIIAAGDVRAVQQAVGDIAYDVMLEHNELVSPMVYCVDVLRYPISYFAYRTISQGKEVYGVDEERLRRGESIGYLELAIEYRKLSQTILDSGGYRLVVDGAYNAAELCAKGLLLLKVKDLPSSHGGIVQKFGEVWIKSGLLPREMGRRLNKASELRNQARYEPHANIGEDEAKETLALADQFIAALSQKLGDNQPLPSSGLQNDPQVAG